jgi:hypothetical protein
MKKRRWINGVCVVASAAVACIVLAGLSAPRYRGRSAHDWFQAYCDSVRKRNVFLMQSDGLHVAGTSRELIGEELDAFRAMREKGVHYLEGRISSKAFGSSSLYARAYRNLPGAVRQVLPNPYGRDMERAYAVFALGSLGAAGQKAIGTVVDYLIDSPSNRPFYMAVHGLHALNPPPSEIDRLITALEKQGRFAAARLVIDQRLVPSRAVAIFAANELARDSSRNIWPFQTLRRIGPEAFVVLPMLTANLRSTNAEIRYQSARTLELIGPSATNALESLRTCLTDESQMVRSAAARALSVISPQ